jgi:hypothetical protein
MTFIQHTSTLFIILYICLVILVSVSSSYKLCESSNQCSVGSECVNGRCSNPFAKGCLVTMKERLTRNELLGLLISSDHDEDKIQQPEFSGYKIRSCNSFDDKKTRTTTQDGDANCIKPVFPYEEIRISPGNWRRSILVSTVAS